MIPAWNSHGVLPPTRPGLSGTAPDRSPYRSSMTSFIDVMGRTPARSDILTGLLKFRDEISKLGIHTGFQWLDGSFSENVEVLENRAPNDVDVVTFFQLPDGVDEAALFAKNPKLFDREHVKNTYFVDSYWHRLGEPMEDSSIRLVSYWYSMWSHKKNGIWKGFVQVSLGSSEDKLALEKLDEIRAGLGVIV